MTNFKHTLPDADSGLAQEITKDPYNFAFTGITRPYNERILKEALLHNITRFLTELGTGFAYVGKEYRLQVGETENFIDLLFYNLNLSCYVVIEVKIGKFTFNDVGQFRAVRRLCRGLQPYLAQGREGQPYHRTAYLQGERPHTSTICIGVEQPTHRHLRVRPRTVLSRKDRGHDADHRRTGIVFERRMTLNTRKLKQEGVTSSEYCQKVRT